MSKEKKLEFFSYDLQPDGLVKPSSLLKQMQQLAREDLNQFNLTYQKMRELNMIFVLVKLNLKMHRPIMPREDLLLFTNPKQVSGASFYRDFLITGGDSICAECASVWVLIDFKNRKPLRPSSLPVEIPHNPENGTSLSIDRTLVLEGEPSSLGEREVYYSYLDENNHLNNTLYADFVCDYMPASFRREGKRISSLKINFLNEARLGDTLSIQRVIKGNEYLIAAENIKSQNNCFVSLIGVC